MKTLAGELDEPCRLSQVDLDHQVEPFAVERLVDESNLSRSKLLTNLHPSRESLDKNTDFINAYMNLLLQLHLKTFISKYQRIRIIKSLYIEMAKDAELLMCLQFLDTDGKRHTKYWNMLLVF